MMGKLGESAKDLTLIFNRGMNSQEFIGRIDEKKGLHFITSYSPYFAQELASIPLKRFKTLDCRANEQIQEKDKILFYETNAPFWGRTRKVVIIFNLKTFRKK